MTPFEATYGKPPPSFTTYILGSSPVEAVDHMLTTGQELWALLTTRLQKAQQTMKTQADNRCRDVTYQVGD